MARAGRWWALTGPVAAVVAIIATLVGGNTPNTKAAGDTVVAYYHRHSGNADLSYLCLTLVSVLLVFFGCYLRGALRSSGAGDVAAIAAAVGSAVLAAGLLVEAMLTTALVDASTNSIHDAAVARTLNVLENDDYPIFVGGLTLVILASGIAILASRALPAWFGWVSVVLGVLGLLGPGGFAVFILSPVWLLVIGIWLFMREDAAASATPGGTPGGTSVPASGV